MALLSGDELWKTLRSGKTIISDGAIGSLLMGEGIAPDQLLSTNVHNPILVDSVHKAYINSHADFITSNTFGLRRSREWQAEVLAGISLAVNAARTSAREIGLWFSLAPATVILESDSLSSMSMTASDSPPMYLIETCTGLAEARAAMRTALTLRHSVLAITAHFGVEGTMLDGTLPETFAESLVADGADIVGCNCGSTPDLFVDVTRRMRSRTKAPLLVQPSAGIPTIDDSGETRYPVSPELFAKTALELVNAGADIVGGCCGTSPLHIEAFHCRLRSAY